LTVINHSKTRPIDSTEVISVEELRPPVKGKRFQQKGKWMPNEMNKANQARRKLFEAREFQDETAERLNLTGAMVTNAIGALLAAALIPCSRSNSAEALAVDGATLLMAIGSQVRADAIARVTTRFAAMTLQIDTDRPKGAAATGTKPRGPVTFEDDLSAMFQHSWKAARSASHSSINAMGVSLLWHDPRGSVLFGTIDRWERGKPRYKKIYASESMRLPAAPGGDWDFIHLPENYRLPTVGGTIFSPPPLLGFCELLAEGVEETAASVS
jgi:hypothetical protein